MVKQKQLAYINTTKAILKTLHKMHKKYPEEESYQTAMFDHALRWSNYRMHAAYISKEACKLSKKMRIDLQSTLWVNSRKVDPNKEFMLDHMYTMKGCNGKQFFSSKCRKKDILNAIELSKMMAWITKKENTVLNKQGFKSDRPNGPEAAYKQCKIELIKINQGS